MADPPIQPLEYASREPRREQVSPARLGAACALWSLPIPLVLFSLRLSPDEIVAIVATTCVGIPLVFACALAGLAILPAKARWRWFWLLLLPSMIAIGLGFFRVWSRANLD